MSAVSDGPATTGLKLSLRLVLWLGNVLGVGLRAPGYAGMQETYEPRHEKTNILHIVGLITKCRTCKIPKLHFCLAFWPSYRLPRPTALIPGHLANQKVHNTETAFQKISFSLLLKSCQNAGTAFCNKTDDTDAKTKVRISFAVTAKLISREADQRLCFCFMLSVTY